MRRVLKISSIVVFLLLGTALIVTAQTDNPHGTIRGGVYLDTDGDGLCSTAIPIANIDIIFTNENSQVTLYTGANGTYGLPSAGQGTWQITAIPDPTKWTITSANPLAVTVHENGGFVQLNNNFCITHGGSASAAPTISTIETFTATAVSNHNVSTTLLTTPATTTNADVADATVTAQTDSNWLSYLNLFRDMAGLPHFSELEALSEGSRDHAQYMVMNDKAVAHDENEDNPFFTPEGKQAAHNGNIFATSQLQADYIWGMNFWTSAPFHLLPIINPDVESAGFGRYNQSIGQFHMAAVLDVRTELGNATTAPTYPIYFPGEGAETWIVRRSLYEWPNPLGNCAGYSVPTGPAIILQLGDGSLTPEVTSHAFYQGTQLLESCVFDETNYLNPDGYAQQVGRTIIGEQDAVVLIPKNQLPINETFTVQIEANGEMHTWSFSTRKGPPEQ